VRRVFPRVGGPNVGRLDDSRPSEALRRRASHPEWFSSYFRLSVGGLAQKADLDRLTQSCTDGVQLAAALRALLTNIEGGDYAPINGTLVEFGEWIKSTRKRDVASAILNAALSLEESVENLRVEGLATHPRSPLLWLACEAMIVFSPDERADVACRAFRDGTWPYMIMQVAALTTAEESHEGRLSDDDVAAIHASAVEAIERLAREKPFSLLSEDDPLYVLLHWQRWTKARAPIREWLAKIGDDDGALVKLIGELDALSRVDQSGHSVPGISVLDAELRDALTQGAERLCCSSEPDLVALGEKFAKVDHALRSGNAAAEDPSTHA
jgi:hypothetical protein